MLPIDTAPNNDAAWSTGDSCKCHIADTVFRISVYTRSKHRPRSVPKDDRRYIELQIRGAISVMLFIMRSRYLLHFFLVIIMTSVLSDNTIFFIFKTFCFFSAHIG